MTRYRAIAGSSFLFYRFNEASAMGGVLASRIYRGNITNSARAVMYTFTGYISRALSLIDFHSAAIYYVESASVAHFRYVTRYIMIPLIAVIVYDLLRVVIISDRRDNFHA